MAVTYNLVPIPRWYFADNYGRPLGGGKMFTYYALNKAVQRDVFMDPNGFIAWTNPVIWDLNGMQGPFYWQFDDTAPLDTYYIEVYDKDNNLVFTQDFFGAPGSGGGGSITYVPLNNLITNNVFLNHINAPTGAPLTPLPAGNTVIAPGAHNAFQEPDILFHKDVAGAVDAISFPLFPQGTAPLTDDSVPVDYLQYTSNTFGGETTKYIQIPLQPKVTSMELRAWTFTIWARATVGTDSIQLNFVQNFGDGGAPSPPVISPIGAPLALTITWTKFVQTFSVPTVALKILGTCGSDANYLRINFNPAANVGVELTKPSMYQGTVPPQFDFQTSDIISAVTHSARTADVKTTYNLFSSNPEIGWVPMDDGSIGSMTSGATNRAAQDTFFLYQTLWNNVSNLYAPVTGGRGGSAILDFSANKAMLLTRMLGRTMAGVITPRVTQTFTVAAPPNTTTMTVATTAHFYTGAPVALSTSGTLPNTTLGPLVPGQTYYVRMLSGIALALAPTPENAIAGTALIVFSDAGVGTHQIVIGSHQLGEFLGEEIDTLVFNNLPTFTPTGSVNLPTLLNQIPPLVPPGIANAQEGPAGATLTFPLSMNPVNPGGAQPFSIMQPTTYVNVFIKL